MRTATVLTAMLAIASGCAAQGDDAPYCPPLEPSPANLEGAVHQYVVDSIVFPTSATEAKALGLDLDGDRRADNALGQIISTVAYVVEIPLNDEIAALVADGQILHLAQIRATSLLDAQGVEVTIAHAADGDGDPTDNFSGQEEFELDPSVGIGTITGTIDEGELRAAVGELPLRITFPGLGEPITFRLFAAKFEATVDDAALVGRLAGALPAEDTDETLVPVLHLALSRALEQDCDRGVCEPDSTGELILQLFDRDDDGVLTLEELQTNDLIASLLSPDLDMRDEHGTLSPRCDQVKDALSIGIGFTAVPASFPEP